MAMALNETKRDIFFSICNWGQEGVTSWAPEIGGSSWRISADIEDEFSSVVNNVRSGVRSFVPDGYGPTTGWNDPDML